MMSSWISEKLWDQLHCHPPPGTPTSDSAQAASAPQHRQRGPDALASGGSHRVRLRYRSNPGWYAAMCRISGARRSTASAMAGFITRRERAEHLKGTPIVGAHATSSVVVK